MLKLNDFNPRLREGGDPMPPVHSCHPSDFNPRLREGGDLNTAVYAALAFDFNPRLREGGDVLPQFARQPFSEFQSTPPRRRRPCSFLLAYKILISIHASAKEATIKGHSSLDVVKFQSTPPRRRRLDDEVRQKSQFEISIHASAKEATQMLAKGLNGRHISIHASAKEAT